MLPKGINFLLLIGFHNKPYTPALYLRKSTSKQNIYLLLVQ